jgi:hypothetical protein
MPLIAPVFRDVKFMSVDDKRLVYQQWCRFLGAGMPWEKFTDRIYKHLSLHCGHIAHFNREGFYQTWFADGASRREFINLFLSDSLLQSHRSGGPDYEDNNGAMASVLEARKDSLLSEATSAEVARLQGERARIDARLRELGA